jgi:hypothetical protein
MTPPNTSDMWIFAALITVAGIIYAVRHASDCPECGRSGTRAVSDRIKIPCWKCGGTGKV